MELRLNGTRPHLDLEQSPEHGVRLVCLSKAGAVVTWRFAPGSARTMALSVPRLGDPSPGTDRYLASVVLLRSSDSAPPYHNLLITAAIGLREQGPREVALSRGGVVGSENLGVMPCAMIAYGPLSLDALMAVHRERLAGDGPLPVEFLSGGGYVAADGVHNRMVLDAQYRTGTQAAPLI